MAAEQSIKTLSFNFGTRIFAYKRLAQGLNRSLSAFKSFVREDLDPIVKTYRCTHHVGDNRVAAHATDELIQNIQVLFQFIDKVGRILFMEKCSFDYGNFEFLGKTISSQRNGPIEKKIEDILKNLKLPKSVKLLQMYIGFVIFYRQYLLNLREKLIPLYKLQQKTSSLQ